MRRGGILGTSANNDVILKKYNLFKENNSCIAAWKLPYCQKPYYPPNTPLQSTNLVQKGTIDPLRLHFLHLKDEIQILIFSLR